MHVIPLGGIEGQPISRIGGKAAGLGALIAAGERVPAGFCVTTEAFDAGKVPEDEVLAAYAELGEDVAVAVRSSATAEDLPGASFAGQQDTVLDVRGPQQLLAAVQDCWDSLHTERAVAYREAQGVLAASMAVVVQRMVSPRAAGVLFTADPLTGTRSTMIVDAAPGLGTTVVDGSADVDHYRLGADGTDGPEDGCLEVADLEQLRAAGERVEHHRGAPQDIEFAIDRDGTLWLLQSRDITTLFPLPPSSEDGTHVYMEVGHMQGMLRPFTPLGFSAMRDVTGQWAEALGLPASALASMMTTIGGRMYMDLTAMVRHPRMRRGLADVSSVYGPRIQRGLQQVLQDPRFAEPRRTTVPVRAIARVAARMAPSMVRGVASAMLHPERTVRRSLAAIEQTRRASTPPSGPMSPQDRLRTAEQLHLDVLSGPMLASLDPLWTAMACQKIAGMLLTGLAEESELAAILRGCAHNVTTDMDLELWRLADAAREHRELLTTTASDELARAHLAGELPDIGLEGFLERYGHRAAAEIDIGVPRWEEDPAPLFDVIAGYLQLEDRSQAPDQRFARAAEEAEATLAELVERARRERPLRALPLHLLLRRARDLMGLRELPKFLWLFPLREMRRQLLHIGADLAEQGLLERAEDVMFLELDEVRTAIDHGQDQREPAARRRAEHEREMRRRQVPGLLLSDGTDVEATLPVLEEPGAITGLSAAPGLARGRARVITDARGARIEPGEILVAPTTDPGWTPLFLTAAGLVTETGSPVAHGPTVAREYGIPAVICVRDATSRLSTGAMIEVDGHAGTIRVLEDVGGEDGAGADS